MPSDQPIPGSLIGRTGELARLARLSGADTDTPGPGVVLLSGDAGVGKTRLLSELRTLAHGAGRRVLVGHCLDFGDSTLPYLPLREAFSTLQARSPALADEITDRFPAVTRLMPGRQPPPIPGDTHQVDRGELFEAVHGALSHLGAHTPLLLEVEDLHWADRSTRELLSFLFARPFPAPVSIVASYRADDLHRRHPLRAATAEWTRLAGVHRIHLAPLGEEDVRDLIHTLRSTPLPESQTHTIVERAEGNAFFVEELVAAMETSRQALPADLADLLLVRLDHLEDDTRSTVRVAAVAGRRVTHTLLSHVVDLDATRLDRAVRSAVEHNILVPRGDDGYAFRHALLAEAVYDDLLPGERVRLHAACMRVLAAEHTTGSAAEVARHARAAHNTPTAITASVRAGEEAMSVGGPDEAARHYEIALELLDTGAHPDGDPVDVVHLTVRAGEAAVAAGHPYRAVAVIDDRLRQTPDAAPPQQARLLTALASAALLYDSDVDVDTLATATAALHLLPAEPATPLRAQVLSVLARASADRRRYDEAARWAGEAQATAHELDLPDILADATTTLAHLEERIGDPESSGHTLRQIITDARTAGDAAAELRALHHLGGLHFAQGELDAALQVYLQGTERARALDRPWAPFGLDSRILAALTAYQCGRWDTAQHIVDMRGQAPSGLPEAALAAVGMAVPAGRGDQHALNLLTHIRPWWRLDGMIAILSGGAAIDLHGDHGDLDAAQAVHDDLITCIGDLWQTRDFQARIRLSALLLGVLAAEAARPGTPHRDDLVRRGTELAVAADRVSALPGRHGPEMHAWLARVRAEHLRLRRLAGTDVPVEDELITAWRDCVAAFERYPHVFELARSQARLGAELAAAGHLDPARTVTDTARATAHRLGARPLLTELGVTEQPAADHRATGARPDTVLTPRERETLTLVADGRSNREIAAQLYISAKTVSVHVSNILAKLDASSRTEAAAIAHRRGLLPR